MRALDAPVGCVDERLAQVERTLGALPIDARDMVRKAMLSLFWDAYHAGVTRAESTPCRHCGNDQRDPPPRSPPRGDAG